MGSTSRDITGQRFGTWVALQRDGLIYGKSIAWICQCDCGTVRRVAASLLARGHSRGCGCANHKALGDRARRHGKMRHRLYGTWTSMHARCRNPKHHAFSRYGLRGIAVCPEWLDFEAFLADMEPSWREGLTLDRIDNDGPYSASNCRWATHAEQARNRKGVKSATFRGETRTLPEWAEIVGIKLSILELRLYRGWAVERALTEQPRAW